MGPPKSEAPSNKQAPDTSSRTEKEFRLSQGATEGPPGRFDEVLAREGRRLFRFIRKRVGDEGDAEDIVQDVLFELVSTPSVTEPIENLTAWLFTVARNRIVDWYRRRKPSPETEVGDDLDGPEWAFWRSSFWSELEEALADLPEEQRDVFVENELQGVTFKEMAERSGEPIGTLLSRKHHAVAFLRKRLRDLHAELESL
jgi:RNA polymerase sigma factor (sigma-70 family)